MFKWNCIWLHPGLLAKYWCLILSLVIFVPDTFFNPRNISALTDCRHVIPFYFSLLPRVSANLYDNQYRFAQTSTVLNKHARTLVPTFWLDERALYPSNSAKCDFISTLDDKLKWWHSHHLHDNQQLSIMPMLVFDADSKPFPDMNKSRGLLQSYDLSYCLPVFLSCRAFTLQQNTRGCGWFSPHSHFVLKSLWKTHCMYVVSSSPLLVYRAWAAPLQLLLQAYCI